MPPEGIHPEAGNKTAALPTPPGATKEQVALDDRMFRGEVDRASDQWHPPHVAKGTPVGPDAVAAYVWAVGHQNGRCTNRDANICRV